MPVVKKVVKKAAAPEAKKPVAKKAEVKKTVVKKAAPEVKKASVAKKPVAKKAEVKKGYSFGKKKVASNDFKIIPGKQATQEMFIAELQKRLLQDNFEDVTKLVAKKISDNVFQTLAFIIKENRCPFNIPNLGYVAQRHIVGRTTHPPMSEHASLILPHDVAKMTIPLDEDFVKAGDITENNTFVTLEGEEYDLEEILGKKKEEEVAEEEEATEEEAEEEEVAEEEEATEEEAEEEEEEESEEEEEEEDLFDDED